VKVLEISWRRIQIRYAIHLSNLTREFQSGNYIREVSAEQRGTPPAGGTQNYAKIIAFLFPVILLIPLIPLIPFV